MTRLPKAEQAIIETEKLHDYLLSSTHPVGRFKAAAFLSLGYSVENWEEFERGLRVLILIQDVRKVEGFRYGNKYVVEGELTGPSGKSMKIVTVWIILKSEIVPRFITAYPGDIK